MSINQLFTKPVVQKVPELYPENLETLKTLLGYIEDLSRVDGVFEIEIRVRVDDVSTWAILGWGESGDPCVLRFETDEIVAPPQPVKRGGYISTDPLFPYTINKIGEDDA